MKTDNLTHTPAPWKVVNGNADDYQKGELCIEALNGERCICLLCDDDSLEQILPDARLISMAPELLEALEDVLEYAGQEAESLRELINQDDVWKEHAEKAFIAIDRACNAIKKARGL